MRTRFTGTIGFIDPDFPWLALNWGMMTIEDDVWIGASRVILNGATLRHGCEVVTNSMVNLELAPYLVNTGSSCREIDFCK